MMGQGKPFYSVYKIGDHTFHRHKAVWKEIAGKISGKGAFDAAVPSTDEKVRDKPAITDHKIMFTAFRSEEEAHYVCAVLNSSIARLIVAASTIETSIAPRILRSIKLLRFEPRNGLHNELASLSREAHRLTSLGRLGEIAQIEDRIDSITSKMYGLTEVKESLAILLGTETRDEQQEQNRPSSSDSESI